MTVCRRALLLPLAVLVALASNSLADNWPAWRGPTNDGISTEKNLPVKWSATENLRWKVPLEGAGVSAPIVWGDHIFLTSSSGRLSDQLFLSCHHRSDGRQLWRIQCFGSAQPEGQFAPGGMAVPTAATDGQRVYALFGTGDLVCVDFDGKPVWIRSLAQEYGPFRNRWGMAASPILVGDMLIVQVDHFGQSYLLAVDAASGATRWKTNREAQVNWTSPLAVKVDGRTQIVAAGTHTIKGYDAKNGAELWTVQGLLQQCIPSPVVHKDLLFALAGQEQNTLAIRLDGRTGDLTKTNVAWKVRCAGANIPSPICLDAHYYYVGDGFVTCHDTASGKRVWRERLAGKPQASPVAGDGKLYFTNEGGVVTVMKAGAETAVLAKNELGEEVVASPAISDGQLFFRGTKHLFCIGTK